MQKNKKTKFPSELRMDAVSNDWVVIATGRARKPESFKKEKRLKRNIPEKECPFCNIETQKKPILIMVNGRKIGLTDKIPKNWTTVVIPNKYPAFAKSEVLDERFEGPLYKAMDAVGSHEIVITKDHKKQIANLKIEQVKEIFDVYQERYLDLMNEKFVSYVSIFHNHGLGAGASVFHPHSQIITTPLLDADLKDTLLRSKKYFENKNPSFRSGTLNVCPSGKPLSKKSCIYCEMIEWEKKINKRVVLENKDFIAICPFASNTAFEVIISPKKHFSYFERIIEKEKLSLAEIFQKTMKKIYKGLQNPDYNFYLHTAPCDGQNHEYYHWHWTILPKTSVWAGFEIGTKMEISTIEPEKAAEYLRKQ